MALLREGVRLPHLFLCGLLLGGISRLLGEWLGGGDRKHYYPCRRNTLDSPLHILEYMTV